MLYVVLPPREGFGPAKHGAISLCVRDSAIRAAHAVTVVGGQDPAASFPEIPYLQVVARKRWYRSRIDDYGRQLRELVVRRPDVRMIEIHNQPALLPHLKDLGIPLVLFLHNDRMLGARSLRQRRQVVDACAAVCCVSGFIRDRFFAGLGDASKAHVIYNGYEAKLEGEVPEPKRETILFVGRLVPEKGALELVRALERVLPVFPQWSADFVIPESFTKNAPRGSYQSAVHEALERLGAQVTVHSFLPHSDVESLFARSSIAVTPANWDEPFGRTSLEALAYGCALVSTRRGGLAEFVDESCAEILQDVSPETIESALRKLMGDPLLRKSLGQSALRRAADFDLLKPIKSLDKVRCSLLDQ